MWVEHLARRALDTDVYSFPLLRSEFDDDELDFRPLLQSVISDRRRGRDTNEIARAFQRGVAVGLRDAVSVVAEKHCIDTVVLSGGVFQNELLMKDLKSLFEDESISVWTNHAVPANDGGISLGQAAIAAFADARETKRDRTHEKSHA